MANKKYLFELTRPNMLTFTIPEMREGKTFTEITEETVFERLGETVRLYSDCWVKVIEYTTVFELCPQADLK